MRFVVYDGMAETFQRTFDDGTIVMLRRGVVTGVSDEIFKILWDSRKKNRINEVISMDKSAIRCLK